MQLKEHTTTIFILYYPSPSKLNVPNIPILAWVQKESCHVDFKPIYYVKNVISYVTTISCVYSDVNVTPLNLLAIIYYSGTRSFIKSWINLQGEECLIKNTIMCSSSGNKFDERFSESPTAFRRKKGIGLYCSRIHTAQDTILDDKNVYYLRDTLLKLARVSVAK